MLVTLLVFDPVGDDELHVVGRFDPDVGDGRSQLGRHLQDESGKLVRKRARVVDVHRLLPAHAAIFDRVLALAGRDAINIIILISSSLSVIPSYEDDEVAFELRRRRQDPGERAGGFQDQRHVAPELGDAGVADGQVDVRLGDAGVLPFSLAAVVQIYDVDVTAKSRQFSKRKTNKKTKMARLGPGLPSSGGGSS